MQNPDTLTNEPCCLFALVKSEKNKDSHQELQVFYNIPVAPANGNGYAVNLNHFGGV